MVAYNSSYEWDVRREICEVGKRLYDQFFIAGNDGNISVRLSENEILITPTGVNKGMMRPEMILKISPEGELIEALVGGKPSSETRMHLIIYRHRPDIRAVVHAHPPTATGFAVAGFGLDKPFLPEVVVRTGPTLLVPYAIPGGDELPESLVPHLEGRDALLLANHGVVAYSKKLWDAQANLETVELNARILLTAHQLGNVEYLSDEQVRALEKRYRG